MLIPLVLLLVVPSAEPNEAEKLFRQMETKLMKAKTIECVFESKIEHGKKEIANKGTLFLGEGKKFRVELTDDREGKATKVTMISDGATTAVTEDGKTNVTKTGFEQFGNIVRAMMGRFFLSLETLDSAGKDKEFKVEDEWKASDFKLGKKEMVGKKEAQILEYKLTVKKDTIAVTVWVDTKTQLPLKRVLTGGEGDRKATVTETYSKLTVDEKIDPKQFELPKK